MTDLAARIEAALAELPRVAADAPSPVRLPRRLVVTGAGMAEAPARFLVARLAELSFAPAALVPISRFWAEPERVVDPEATLVVFTQGVSPNARVALRLADRFREVHVFTAVDPGEDSAAAELLRGLGPRATLWRHPPAREAGTLLRVAGPLLAKARALAFTAALGAAPEDLSGLADDAVRAAGWARAAPEALVARAPGLVSAGALLDAAWGLGWSWLEGTWGPPPPLWDVLQFAHGPFQSALAQGLPLVSLEWRDSPYEGLFDLWAAQLADRGLTVLRWTAERPGARAVFEHDVALLGLVARAVEGRDLADWPGQDGDRWLYAVERPSRFDIATCGMPASSKSGPSGA